MRVVHVALWTLYWIGLFTIGQIVGHALGVASIALWRHRPRKKKAEFTPAPQARFVPAREPMIIDFDTGEELPPCPNCGEVHGDNVAMGVGMHIAYDKDNGVFVVPVTDVTTLLRACVNVEWGRDVARQVATALDETAISLSVDIAGKFGMPEDGHEAEA